MSTDSNAAIPTMLADYDSQSKDEAIVEVLDRVCANIKDSVIFYDATGAIVARNVHAARTLDIDQKHFSTLKTMADLIQVLAERGDYGDVNLEKEIKRRVNRLLVPISRKSYFVSKLQTLGMDLRVRLVPVFKDWRMMTLAQQTEEEGQGSERGDQKSNASEKRKPTRARELAPDVNALLADDPSEARLYKEDTYIEHITHAIKHANVLESSFALLAIDFPEFESLARARGEDAVFFVYMSMVEELKRVTRNIDVLINVENRRFLAIIECDNADILKKIARRVITSCGEPMALHPQDDSRKQRFTVNIGAVFYPDSVADLSEEEGIHYFRKRAEIAADWARQKGSTEMVIFDLNDPKRMQSPVASQSV